MPKFSNFSEFIDCLSRAQFGFESLWDGLVNLYYSVTQNPDIEKMWSGFMEALAPVMVVMPFIFMVLGAIIGLFGKKMFFILKFTACFILGFVAGVYFLVPIIPESIPIPAWVTGLVMAIVFAVLFKFVYISIYSCAVIYSMYRLCYYGFFLIETPEYSTGKMLACLAVAVIVLAISFILYKFVEMLITSALGSWFLVGGFSAAFINLGEISWILDLAVILIFTVLASVFQIKTRRRY